VDLDHTRSFKVIFRSEQRDASVPSLSRLTSLLRGQSRLDPAALDAYAEQIEPSLATLLTVHRDWERAREFDSTSDEMASTASIKRWEVAGLIDSLELIEPPAQLARLHQELVAVATETARAAQRLSSGYRFHSSRSLCDGQAMMTSVDARLQTLCRELSRLGVSVPLVARVAT
jgi:hypothetical protein